MSEKEFKSFRFTDSNDPSDEMLRHLMRKVAKQAREENRLAENQYFENIRKEVSKQRRVALNG